MIDWVNALWAGIAGGAGMEVFALAVYLAANSRMSMVRYWGCMLTGKNSGAATYLAGWMIHLVLSVLIGFAYAWAFEAIWQKAGWQYGLLLAAAHWAIGGLVFPVMDRFSVCVRRGIIPPLKLYATGDRSSFLIFLVGHLIYGAVIGLWYSV